MAKRIPIDNTESKRRKYKGRSATKREVRCKILIVCEGEKTEPAYFKSFDRKKPGVFVFDLTLEGGGIRKR